MNQVRTRLEENKSSILLFSYRTFFDIGNTFSIMEDIKNSFVDGLRGFMAVLFQVVLILFFFTDIS